MEERLRILEQVERGDMDVTEAARRLRELTAGDPVAASQGRVDFRPQPAQRLWLVAFWPALAMMTGGGYLLATFYTRPVAARWAVWGWILFAFGSLGLMLAWWLQRACWLYVRVRQPGTPTILIALPLPLRLVAWGFRIARPFTPQFKGLELDELLLALESGSLRGQPLSIEVNGGPGRAQVQVYIG